MRGLANVGALRAEIGAGTVSSFNKLPGAEDIERESSFGAGLEI
jgi:hypothetical protein